MRRSVQATELSQKRITRRALVMGGAQIAIIGVLGLRMRQLQIRDAKQYRMLAEDNRINLQLIAPARGRILDRFGDVLADNRPTYQVTIVREQAGDLASTLRQLQLVLPITDDDIAEIMKSSEKTSAFVPLSVAEDITWEDLARVAVNAPALPGVNLETVLQRTYPFGSDFAHTIGYVGRVSSGDLEAVETTDPLLSLPGFKIGKTSIEKTFEKELRGAQGTLAVEVNATGRVMRDLKQTASISGEDLHLTLDHHLQNFTFARLGDQSAAAVVMDVRNGDILASASAPSFDPNLFVNGISSRDYGLLRDSEYRPFADKTVQGAYPPGSTVKMSLALAALEAEVVKEQDTVACPGFVEIAGRRFHCWKRGGHGRVNLQAALRESCDVFFYEMAQRVGIEGLNAMNTRLGLGQKPDLPFSGMSAGVNPSRLWKQEKQGSDWLIGDTINASIGQGFVLATPMQLAVMTARIASGRAVMPRIVKPMIGSVDPDMEPLGLRSSSLALVHRGMFDVVNSGRGTAKASRIVAEGQPMAGKTGSSQVFSITAEERAAGVRSQADLPWKRRDHALFTAFAPFDKPEIAVSVLVEHGGGGSTAAAPIARDLVLFYLNGGLPTPEAYPADQRGRISTDLQRLSSLILPPDTVNGGHQRG
ncbi:penicillin-binding protein 2 [Pseudorhodobacter turbinis]|uniref:Penicillin-binding protein 2 n=1 Tax=Pseudorhodobacter turbinis TaxID=2500533 RepID=A0A4P8EG92_9RHOB|nr:penicillin-binding protein 2 [Pseudorhodobacter turbinis]